MFSVHSVKPLDTEAILKSRSRMQSDRHGGRTHGARRSWRGGGLHAIAGRRVKPFRIVGIPDEETVPGAQADIFRHHGISMEGLSETAMKLLNDDDHRPRPVHFRQAVL